MSKLWTPEQTEENNVVPFAKPVIKPKGSPPANTKGWLRNIEVNSLFLVRDSLNYNYKLEAYQLVNKTLISAILYSKETDIFWVDIDDFSDRFIFQELLGKVVDDDNTGAIQQSPVEDNADA